MKEASAVLIHIADRKTFATACSGNLANHVLAPERIRQPERTLRIILPLAIHEEPIVISARLQLKAASPNAIGVLAQVNWSLLPVCEVTNQLNAQRGWCAIGECLRVCRFAFLCHSFPFVSVVCVHK